jgi:cytochrome c
MSSREDAFSGWRIEAPRAPTSAVPPAARSGSVDHRRCGGAVDWGVRLAACCLAAALTAACAPADPPYDPALARSLYVTNGCVPCHGEWGHGDGGIAQTLTPRPRDFRDPGAFQYGRDVERVAHTIASGLLAYPTPMPAYGHLSLHDRRQLAAYVLSLAGEQ